MKIAKKLFLIALCISVSSCVFIYSMEPVQPENPYVQLRNDAGEYAWVNKEQLDSLLAAANLAPLPQIQEGEISFNYPKPLLNIFAELLLIHQSFLLQGVALQPVAVPQLKIVKDTIQPVFFDDPQLGSHALVYNYFASVLQQSLSQAALFELISVVKIYFPKAYFAVLIWAIFKTQGKNAISLENLPEILLSVSEQAYVTMMYRYAFPPENSIYDRFIIKGEEYTVSGTSEGNIGLIKVDLKNNVSSI